MSGMARANGDYREMPATIVRQGDRWPVDDPVVKAHPEWFDLPSRPVRRAERPAPPVEQTTAAPGERRSAPTRRGESPAE